MTPTMGKSTPNPYARILLKGMPLLLAASFNAGSGGAGSFPSPSSGEALLHG
jgi:hypothetical protein